MSVKTISERKIFIEVSPAELAEFEAYLKNKKEREIEKKTAPTEEMIFDLISRIPNTKKFKEVRTEGDTPMSIENGTYTLRNGKLIFDYRIIIKEK